MELKSEEKLGVPRSGLPEVQFSFSRFPQLIAVFEWLQERMDAWKQWSELNQMETRILEEVERGQSFQLRWSDAERVDRERVEQKLLARLGKNRKWFEEMSVPLKIKYGEKPTNPEAIKKQRIEGIAKRVHESLKSQLEANEQAGCYQNDGGQIVIPDCLRRLIEVGSFRPPVHLRGNKPLNSKLIDDIFREVGKKFKRERRFIFKNEE